jgi:hypothetical protein
MSKAVGRGLAVLEQVDLTGYLSPAELASAVSGGLVGPPRQNELSVDPMYRRPPMLIIHETAEMPPHVDLPSGTAW